MSERLVRERYLTVAARLEGLIEAHRMLKQDDGDDTDRMLWRLAEETLEEVYGDERL
jgi:hypothetical protein